MDRTVTLLQLIDSEAEQTSLSVMTNKPELTESILPELKEEYYADEKRQWIYKAIVRIANTIDDTTPRNVFAEIKAMQNEYKAKNRVAPEELMNITLDYIQALPGNPETIDDCLERLSNMAAKRHMARHSLWALDKVQERGPVSEWHSDYIERLAESETVEEGERITYGEDIVSKGDAIQATAIANFASGIFSPFDWPWKSWNSLLLPITFGKPTLLVGPPSSGKSTWMLSIAQYWAGKGHDVCYIHTEDPFIDIYRRMVCQREQIEYRNLETGALTDIEFKLYEIAKKKIKDSLGNRLHFIESIGKSMRDILKEVKAMVKANKCEIVVFDYFASLGANPSDEKDEFRGEKRDFSALHRFSATIVKPNGEVGIPVLVGDQGNKNMSSVKANYSLNDVFGSSFKIWASKTIIMIRRKRVEEEINFGGTNIFRVGEKHPDVEIVVEKQNNGKDGIIRQWVDGGRFSIYDGSVYDAYKAKQKVQINVDKNKPKLNGKVEHYDEYDFIPQTA